MQTITITGLDRVRDPKPSQNGHSILSEDSRGLAFSLDLPEADEEPQRLVRP